MSEPSPPPARSFGSVADAYDRGRPSYPREAAAFLTGPEPLTVLELGAGTGKLTEQLLALGHDVHATEPDPAMLAVLRERLPEVRTSQTGAEEIPASDRAFDVVVAAQCFHWFDAERALPEIARVLKPGGHLSLVWNLRDERIPWVRRLGALIGNQDAVGFTDPGPVVAGSGLFEEAQQTTYKQWQVVDRTSIRDLVLSRSNIALLEEPRREATLAAVTAFYDDYGRGMDGMQLPYNVECYRARLRGHVEDAPLDIEREDGDETKERRAVSDDSGFLLIDFR